MNSSPGRFQERIGLRQTEVICGPGIMMVVCGDKIAAGCQAGSVPGARQLLKIFPAPSQDPGDRSALLTISGWQPCTTYRERFFAEIAFP